MKQWWAMSWGLVLGLGVGAAAQEPAAPAERPGQLKKARVMEVVRDLANEARQELRTLKHWPRRESEYAIKNNLIADSEEVIRAMGKRLDRDPALDGYIKWQLLSFSPNYAEAGIRGFEQLVRGLPDLMQRPQPNGSQRRLFSQFEKSGNERLVTKIQQQIDLWQTQVLDVERLNEPAIAFRDAILFELPADNGLKLTVRMMDVEARYVAGHLSYREMVEPMIREAAAGKDAPWSPAVRQRLIEYGERLKMLAAPYVREVTVAPTGQVTIVPFGGIFENEYEHVQLMAYLNGKEPPPPPDPEEDPPM